MNSPYMTTREVMDFLHVGKTTVFALIRDHKIRTSVVCGKRLAYRDSVVAFARMNDVDRRPVLAYPKHGVGRMIQLPAR